MALADVKYGHGEMVLTDTTVLADARVWTGARSEQDLWRVLTEFGLL